jgi:hypothetical protein
MNRSGNKKASETGVGITGSIRKWQSEWFPCLVGPFSTILGLVYKAIYVTAKFVLHKFPFRNHHPTFWYYNLAFFIMLNVEWESSVIQHGHNRGTLKSSTVHGWLVKMRGTLVGDEKMRWRGIQEMKAASRHRKRNAARPPSRRSSGSRKKSNSGGIFSSLFGSTTKRSSRHGGKSRHLGPRAPRRSQTTPIMRASNRPTPTSRRSSHRPSGQSRRSIGQGSRQQARRANTR